MVDRQSIGRSAHRKGKTFENDTAKAFTKWYIEEYPKARGKRLFYRVPASGALDWEASMNVDGDVTADPKINFNYLIECKCYEGWTIENLLSGNFKFPEWISQSVREGMNINKVPFLVYKRSRSKVFVTAPYNKKIVDKIDTVVIKTLEYTSQVTKQKEKVKTVTFLLTDFFKIPYSEANKLYDSVDWTKQITRFKTKQVKPKNPNTVADNILENLEKI